MKPKLISATILGGMTGVFINVLFGSGLRAPAAPGSIIAVYAQTASGSFLGVTLSVLGAATVSFLVASLLLKTDRAADEPDLAAATAEMEAMKGKKSSVAAALVGATGAQAARSPTSSSPATPVWGRRRWEPRCFARRSRRRASATSRWPTGHLQPDRHLRSRGHAPGSDRPRPPEDTVGGPRLRRRLHEQPALRRDRRTARADQRRRSAGAAAACRCRCRRGGAGGRGGGTGWRCARTGFDCAERHRRPTVPRRDHAKPASCWSPPERWSRRTSTRCTSARSRCPPTWATAWRFRTAPTRPRTPSAGPASRSCATPSRSTGTASRPSSSSASRVPARTTWRC